MINIRGAKAHKKRLRTMRGKRMFNAVSRVMFKSAQDLQTEAQLSLTKGAVSGKNHVPSVAPDPPNQDSGVLGGGIEADKRGPLKAETSSNAPYALAQEFGSESQNLPERPYMRPAAKKIRKTAPGKVVAAVRKVVASGGR